MNRLLLSTFNALLAIGLLITIVGRANADISGTVHLQGRTDHSGVSIEVYDVTGGSVFSTTTTPTSGDFYSTGTATGSQYRVTATKSGYVKLDNSSNLIVRALPLSVAQLTDQTLAAGDTNGDAIINILDLAFLGGSYGCSTACGNEDFNDDGVVNIQDLALLGGNYGVEGTSNWPWAEVALTNKVVIVKDTVPDSAQDFAFTTTGGLSPVTFDLDDDDDGTLSNTQTFSSLATGSYTVSEAASAGYTTTLECDDPDGGSATDGATATIDIDPGETVTCTFTNTELGSLTIVKEAKPEDGTDFGFTSDIPGGATFNLDDANPDDGDGISQSIKFDNLANGSYDITETLPSGWQLNSTACSGGSDNGSLIDQTLSVVLGVGEDVTCTFTNTVQPGKIIIVKDTVPDSAQDFAFTTKGGLSPTTFDLDDDADGTLPNMQTYTDVAAGSYTVTEAAVDGYITTLGCSDPDGGSSTDGATATIDLDPGEEITCNFRNAVNQIFLDGFEGFCPEGQIDIEVAVQNNHVFIQRVGFNLDVTVTNIGSISLDIVTLVIEINGQLTDLTVLLPYFGLNPGELIVVSFPYEDWDGLPFISGTASVEADGSCGPPVMAEDVFDLPVNPD